MSSLSHEDFLVWDSLVLVDPGEEVRLASFFKQDPIGTPQRKIQIPPRKILAKHSGRSEGNVTYKLFDHTIASSRAH